MKMIDKLETFTEKLRLIEDFMNKTQTDQSPKIQRIFKRMQSIEKAQSTMKQAQQVQSLMKANKGPNSIESALPLLILLLNNISVDDQ